MNILQSLFHPEQNFSVLLAAVLREFPGHEVRIPLEALELGVQGSIETFRDEMRHEMVYRYIPLPIDAQVVEDAAMAAEVVASEIREAARPAGLLVDGKGES